VCYPPLLTVRSIDCDISRCIISTAIETGCARNVYEGPFARFTFPIRFRARVRRKRDIIRIFLAHSLSLSPSRFLSLEHFIRNELFINARINHRNIRRLDISSSRRARERIAGDKTRRMKAARTHFRRHPEKNAPDISRALVGIWLWRSSEPTRVYRVETEQDR